MLKLVIAIALVIGSVQCAAACTPVECAQPPCHHHKQAPACKHELIPATVVQLSAIDVTFAAEAIDAPPIDLLPVSFQASPIQDPSPPGQAVPPLTILRI